MFDGGHSTSTARIFVMSELLWPQWSERVIPSLQKMADNSEGRNNLKSLIDLMKTGQMHIWVITDGDELLAVAASEIVVYPLCRAFRIVGMVGRRPRRWMHILANVEQVARDVFLCTKMECLHQLGHERMLRTPGWRLWHQFSEKNL